MTQQVRSFICKSIHCFLFIYLQLMMLTERLYLSNSLMTPVLVYGLRIPPWGGAKMLHHLTSFEKNGIIWKNNPQKMCFNFFLWSINCHKGLLYQIWKKINIMYVNDYVCWYFVKRTSKHYWLTLDVSVFLYIFYSILFSLYAAAILCTTMQYI